MCARLNSLDQCLEDRNKPRQNDKPAHWDSQVTALLYNLFKHLIKQLQNLPHDIVLCELGSSLDFLDKNEVSLFSNNNKIHTKHACATLDVYIKRKYQEPEVQER